MAFQRYLILGFDRLRQGAALGGAVLFLITSTGCNSAASGEAHGELHEEHRVPPHKPANFSEAVDTIDRRSDDLTNHADQSHGDEAEKLAELADIIDWIPELAADSDLSEKDWTSATETGQRMGKIVTRLMSSQQPDLSRLHSDLTPLVAELQTLVPGAGIPETRIEHGHHHHGGDPEHEHEHVHDTDNEDGHKHAGHKNGDDVQQGEHNRKE